MRYTTKRQCNCTFSGSDVTAAEINDLLAKLRAHDPQPWRPQMMQYGAGPRKRQKPNRKAVAA